LKKTSETSKKKSKGHYTLSGIHIIKGTMLLRPFVIPKGSGKGLWS